MKINFFVIGGGKSGTSWLHDVISNHPQIIMSKPKELEIFLDSGCNGCNNIKKYFDGYNNEKIVGTSNPTHSEILHFPNVPKNIYEYNKKSKILFIVRNPLERILSSYNQAIKNNHHLSSHYGEKMSINFFEALKNYPALIDANKYMTIVNAYKNYFGNNLLVLRFEEIVDRNQAGIKKILSFLGVSIVELDNNHKNINSTKNQRREGKLYAALRKILGKRFGMIAPAFFKNKIRYFGRPAHEYKTNISNLEKRYIKDTLKDEIIGLYEYLGIKNDPWEFFKN